MINVTEYRKPGTMGEALDLLSSGEFTPIAGGTDLIPQLRSGKLRRLLDIAGLGLSFVREDGDHIEIGATCTHTQLSTDNIIRKFLPLISRATGLVGSWQIRNRGTVGGNIVNASPCADSVPALLDYDAELVLLSKNGQRTVGLNAFIESPYRTALRPDELLHSVRCRKRQYTGHSYIKLGRRQAVNISRMTIAATLFVDSDGIISDIALSGGSIFPAPSRMPDIEKLLDCQRISKSLFENAANIAGDLMIRESGVRWSTPYKKPVLISLIQRALNEASGQVAV